MASETSSSPLSSRDINRKNNEKKEEGNDSVNCGDENRIKMKFNQGGLPKQEKLRRRAENGSVGLVGSTFSSNTTSMPGLSAVNFVEAISRKRTVTITSRAHGQECECNCSPPIEEFVELDELQEVPRTSTSQIRPSTSHNSFSNSPRSLKNLIEVSDEETETEIDEGDLQSAYETPDEFEDECNVLESDLFHSRKANGQEKPFNEKIVAIEKGYDLGSIGKDALGRDNLRNLKTVRTSAVSEQNRQENLSSDDEENLFESNVSKMYASKRRKNKLSIKMGHIICSNPQPVSGTPSVRDEQILTTIADSYNFDKKNEADDEYDTESDSEGEAEWKSDDDLLLSTNRPNNCIQKDRVRRETNENQSISETIDLCDSSSDFSETESDEEWTPDDKSPPSSPEKNYPSREETIEEPSTSEIIDLCDSSSNCGASDSDFTFTDDEKSNVNKQIPSTTSSKSFGKGKSKYSFRRNRDQITTSAFDEFNQNAFGGDLGKVDVLWSKKLNTTAGLTRLQKLAVDTTPGIPLERHAVIELSTKVVDDEEKLRTTLLHELVHAAVWIFEGISKPPHGAAFKRWAKTAMTKIPDVIVTTTHSYQIQYKFNWACVNPKCSFTIGRHSKSVNTIRHRCGRCKGKLIEVTPEGAPKKRAQPSAYNLFVKQYSKAIRERLAKAKPSVTQADVMKEVGRLWREQKAQQSHHACEALLDAEPTTPPEPAFTPNVGAAVTGAISEPL